MSSKTNGSRRCSNEVLRKLVFDLSIKIDNLSKEFQENRTSFILRAKECDKGISATYGRIELLEKEIQKISKWVDNAMGDNAMGDKFDVKRNSILTRSRMEIMEYINDHGVTLKFADLDRICECFNSQMDDKTHYQNLVMLISESISTKCPHCHRDSENSEKSRAAEFIAKRLYKEIQDVIGRETFSELCGEEDEGT